MRNLSTAFAQLNDEQKQAVKHDGNTVVLAGPGSGKTATLVVKVAHLLSSEISPLRGVACLTFNNDAVTEFSRRFVEHGIHGERRLYLGTVHGFCLNCIIRPYGPLVDPGLGSHVRVISDRAAKELLERIAASIIPNLYMPSFSPLAVRIRRALACGESIKGFGDLELEAIAEYERALARQGVVDFEAMVLRSVELVSKHDWIRRLLAARFPWLVVDEYQDLGGPLHRIVTTLADQAGIKVFAVGDPDQTVYDFTGASPKYLNELEHRADFLPIRLKFNYRSGGDLIIAGQAALQPDDGPRPYRPNPHRKDPGQVIFKRAHDDLADHGVEALKAAKEALAAGTVPHEIAILYRQKNQLFPEIKLELDDAGIPYAAERLRVYGESPFVRWLQQAAGWAIAPPSEREALFGDIFHHYKRLLMESGLSHGHTIDLCQRTEFHEFLKKTAADAPLASWLTQLDTRLFLRRALRASRARSEDDLEDFEKLLKSTAVGELCTHCVRDFAEDGRVRGKLVLTTLHGSKGRQFDVVILPGMVEGVMPKWQWNQRYRAWREPEGRALREARRLFYVGFTRARHTVYLIYSKGFRHKGHPIQQGPSRFAKEIAKRLRQDGRSES